MLTEAQVYDNLVRWHGRPVLDKTQARALLLKQIQADPVVLVELPDALLDKLGIHHDRTFSPAELALASKIHGRCDRRIKWAKP